MVLGQLCWKIDEKAQDFLKNFTPEPNFCIDFKFQLKGFARLPGAAPDGPPGRGEGWTLNSIAKKFILRMLYIFQ